MITQRFALGSRKAICFFSLLLATTTLCSAATQTAGPFDFTACNFCTTQPSPYGSVTKTLDTTANTVTFDVVLKDNLDLVNSGFYFNSLFTNLTLVAGSVSYTGPGTFTLVSGGQADGFGNFTYQLDTTANGSDINSNATNELKFAVTSTSPLSLATVDQTNGTAYFAADVSGCTSSTQTGCTGFIGVKSETPSVPEPTSILFFGSGLVAAGFVLRKKLAGQN